jgi:hypothetical protein
VKSETAAFVQTILMGLNLVILIATLIVLILYTKFTHAMQKAVERQANSANEQTAELVRQRRLANLPAFIAIVHEDRSSNRIDLLNIGKGTALNVKAEDVRVPYEDYPDARIVLPAIAYIKPDQRTHPGLDYAGLAEEIAERNRLMNTPPVLRHLNEETYQLTVHFFDIEGNAYEQTLQMNRGKCIPHRVTPH